MDQSLPQIHPNISAFGITSAGMPRAGRLFELVFAHAPMALFFSSSSIFFHLNCYVFSCFRCTLTDIFSTFVFNSLSGKRMAFLTSL